MRKTLFDIAHISAISLAFLVLLSAAASVNAGNTNGGNQEGVPVNVVQNLPQQSWNPSANDFHFDISAKRPGIAINGWQVDIGQFPGVVSARKPGTNNAFTVDANGANVALNGWASVKIKVWLDGASTSCPNQLVIKWWWTLNGAKGTEHNAGAWAWGWPQWASAPTNFNHLFNMTNMDSANNLTIVNLGFLPTMSTYDDLTAIVFPPPYYNITILPLQSWLINITTTGPFYGGHIYFRYNVTLSGDVGGGGALQSAASDPEYYAQQWADHLVTEHITVGGIVLPIAKFSLLAPYIGLASTAMIGVVATVVYVRRAKRREEKQ